MSVDFVILAAGNGSRMKSSQPKFFQTIAGKPIIRYIIEACHRLSGNVIIVTKQEFKDSEYFSDVNVAIQNEPLGTANAVENALDSLKSDYAVILCGDMPLIESEHLKVLIENSNENIIMAMTIPGDLSTMPYGRVILKNGKFEKIVEYKDATEEEKNVNLANTGIYKIRLHIKNRFFGIRDYSKRIF